MRSFARLLREDGYRSSMGVVPLVGWLLLFVADTVVTFVADWLFRTPPQGFEYVRQMDFDYFIHEYWLAFVIMIVWIYVCAWIAVPHRMGKWRAKHRDKMNSKYGGSRRS